MNKPAPDWHVAAAAAGQAARAGRQRIAQAHCPEGLRAANLEGRHRACAPRHRAAQVEAAARLVGLHDLIMALPQGYNSPIGRDGAVLSGGQRQRVGLARALYGKPVFVVLDEPNSSLDEAGDAALAGAIAALKQLGTTFVVMTHRSSILSVADNILLMREGAQQAFGPRDEVLAALQQKAQS